MKTCVSTRACGTLKMDTVSLDHTDLVAVVFRAGSNLDLRLREWLWCQYTSKVCPAAVSCFAVMRPG
jgi:hypothetical protein